MDFFSFDDSSWHRQMSGLRGSNPHVVDEQAARDYATESGTSFTVSKVAAVTFAALFEEHRFERIELLSVDVEGAELNVIETIDFTAVSIHYIVVELNPPVEPWTALLLRNGFRVMDESQLTYGNNHDRWFENTSWVTDV